MWPISSRGGGGGGKALVTGPTKNYFFCGFRNFSGKMDPGRLQPDPQPVLRRTYNIKQLVCSSDISNRNINYSYNYNDFFIKIRTYLCLIISIMSKKPLPFVYCYWTVKKSSKLFVYSLYIIKIGQAFLDIMLWLQCVQYSQEFLPIFVRRVYI